jgi:guanylate kinase
MNFTNPRTLVSLTAPTCSGKSYLLEQLITTFAFNRIVSTTDRAPREGEVHGLHYYFIDTQTSKHFEQQNKFAELVTFNGTRYGVTHAEMEAKLVRPSIVILEPNGVQAYAEYCKKHDIQHFKIFVSTPTDVCIQRLKERSLHDINSGKPVMSVLDMHTARVKSIYGEETGWQAKHLWHVIADGQDAKKSIEMVKQGIKLFNERIK